MNLRNTLIIAASILIAAVIVGVLARPEQHGGTSSATPQSDSQPLAAAPNVNIDALHTLGSIGNTESPKTSEPEKVAQPIEFRSKIVGVWNLTKAGDLLLASSTLVFGPGGAFSGDFGKGKWNFVSVDGSTGRVEASDIQSIFPRPVSEWGKSVPKESFTFDISFIE
ncbi:MAG: hypothetical protein H7144_13635 [Burkholderiales bacterium]|nr:hypothetical protein [Phycisphaerae bacterium]